MIYILLSFLSASVLNATKVDYLNFFRNNLFTNNWDPAIEVRYSRAAGYYTVASREIIRGDHVFEIPCHLILSSFDEWDDKKEIVQIVRKAFSDRSKEISKLDSGWITKAVMALRFMVESKKENPFGVKEKYG